MTEHRDRQEDEPSKALLLRELRADLDQSPARLELERRRLLVNLERCEPEGVGRPYPRGALAAVAAVAAIAAVVAVVLRVAGLGPEASEPLLISGLWRVQLGDDDRPVAVPDGRGAKLVLGEAATLWLAGSSAAARLRGDGFELVEGRALIMVAPRPRGSAFTVSTPHGSVVVHGTVFSVATGTGGARVRLYEGAVDVRGREAVRSLARGHELEVVGGIARSARPIDPTGVIEDLLIARDTAALEGPPLPPLDVPSLEAPRRTFGPRVVLSPRIERPAADASTDAANEPRAPGSRPTAPCVRPTRDEPDASVPFADPRLAEIEVEGAAADDEALIYEAYSEAATGDHATALELLREYVEAHPEGRYWSRVREILGGETAPR